ncbi:autoinducer binding domain-containing protein [Candidatus Rhodobacter oscarellae]|nr:autoinducer binding domain-containing protein [Candidatus Rhodobacter lobularis]
MNNRDEIAGLITALDKMAPAGMALGLHIAFTAPRFMIQTYPRKWLEIYNAKGLLYHDPVVQWGFQNNGTIRWRELAEDDPKDVMGQASRFGMTHGVMVALSSSNIRSFGGFARSDRDFLDVEIDELESIVNQLHHATEHMSDEDIQALRDMSDRLTRG